VTWKSGETSLFAYTLTVPTDVCPSRTGYTKSIEGVYSGQVTGGTARGLVGGTYSGTFCAYQAVSTGVMAVFPLGPQRL
jgi:hypothetical protein